MTADVSLSRAEFVGNCWECGWADGSRGVHLLRTFATLERDLDRPLTGDERQRVRAGYLAGLRERDEYQADMAAAADRPPTKPTEDDNGQGGRNLPL